MGEYNEDFILNMKESVIMLSALVDALIESLLNRKVVGENEIEIEYQKILCKDIYKNALDGVQKDREEVQKAKEMSNNLFKLFGGDKLTENEKDNINDMLNLFKLNK